MKIKYIFFSIALFVCSIKTTIAEDLKSIFSIKMDSLQQLIDSHQYEDEALVRLLNVYARICFNNMDFQNGLSATREARIISNELNFDGGQIMYCLTLSTFFGEGEMHDYYQRRAQWLSKNINEQLSKYFTDLYIPDYNEIDYNWLLGEYNAILPHFEKLNDLEIQAVILADIATCHFMMGNHEETIKVVEKVISIYAKLDQIYPVFLHKSYKMSLLNYLGKNDEARKIELDLIELISQNENENAIEFIASTMATNYRERGRWALAIEYYLKSLEGLSQSDDLKELARINFFLGLSYENLGMNSKAADSYTTSIALLEELQDSTNLYNAYGTLVFPLIALKRYDEAQQFMELALHDTITENGTYFLARYKDAQAQILRDQEKYVEAIPVFIEAFELFDRLNNNRWAAPFMKLYLAECYLKVGNYEMALKEGLKCLEMENALNNENTIVKNKISLLLSEIYDETGDLETAYKYLKMHQAIRAESDAQDEANRIADAEVRSIIEKSQNEIDELEREKLRQEQAGKTQRLWMFSIAGALLSAIILSLILYRNNQNKQKANTVLKEQKEEIESTLEKLESTQSQLIQSEKMASLGELTAGIAHEIQNPLNFVNNFSEVNSELVEELREEVKKGDLGEIDAIAKDIAENEKKIKHHGQRAEGIVKGMLQHSRTSKGEREPTDLNKLADEYLRLAYHGIRAKDKSFNAEFKTDFDESLPKVEVVPQDIGRVMLNMINNAFFAVNEKLKAESSDYKPEVVVSTQLSPLEGGVRGVKISVKDNGPGIPEEIKDKIFQPFYTTKPTGSGTGLGLSLSYDIVKAHGGDLEVNSNRNEGTVFILNLPFS